MIDSPKQNPNSAKRSEFYFSISAKWNRTEMANQNAITSQNSQLMANETKLRML